MSIRKCSVTIISRKIKINTTSSTQSKIVGVHDCSPQVMWTKYFLQNQELNVDTSFFYQDNKSAILLAKNGCASRSNCTKHINIRYYFIQDHVENGDVTMVHCPTDEMTGDYFTKPLQGAKF